MARVEYLAKRLEWNIQRIMMQLDDFQKVYNSLTGKDFVPSKPLESVKKEMDALEE